jgi:hypothetical protein
MSVLRNKQGAGGRQLRASIRAVDRYAKESTSLRTLVVIVVCAMFVGCSGRGDLGQVSGKVTMDGKPLAEARVEFYPTQQGSIASGRTDANGEYSLMFSRDVAGASLGENLVRISTHDVGYEEGKGEFAIPERVPAKYNRDSQLTVKVEPGKQRHDFDLKSDDGKVLQPRTPAGL